MSGFDAIDLSRLPAPTLIDALDYEAILADLRTDLGDRAPELAGALALESEPLNKLLEVCAYRELLLRGRVNDAARGVMLALATGADLDHLGALFNVARLVVQAANPSVFPPVPEILESDAALRRRIQLAPEGYTSAGSRGAYTFHALGASALIRDVSVTQPTPGTVRVNVLGAFGDGTPTSGTLDAVLAALNAETVRPLCDTVLVEAASIVTYQITAALTTYAGPDPAVVVTAAQAAAVAYAAEHHALGHDITLSGLYAALHQPGVQRVALAIPSADLVIADHQAPYCTAITITHAGTGL
ncbi:baseplate J/gp47 family protein [Thiocapsa sp.]|uniref:baseplate assembly protein n=1 Tax=Thiocapsa sp. TaxID=2024551 RepID=UPI0025CF8D3C|nr:baseplate J/gp47 family protein [Thiocapsa sp.]